MEQDKEPRKKPMHLWLISQQKRQEHTMDKRHGGGAGVWGDPIAPRTDPGA